MNRKCTFLALGCALVAALTFALVDTTPPIEASGNFFYCLDACDDAVDACYANCGPNDFQCEFACNNAWRACTGACGADNPGFP